MATATGASRFSSPAGSLTIRKTIAAGRLGPERYAASDAAGALMRSGLEAHLNNNGPVTVSTSAEKRAV